MNILFYTRVAAHDTFVHVDGANKRRLFRPCKQFDLVSAHERPDLVELNAA